MLDPVLLQQILDDVFALSSQQFSDRHVVAEMTIKFRTGNVIVIELHIYKDSDNRRLKISSGGEAEEVFRQKYQKDSEDQVKAEAYALLTYYATNRTITGFTLYQLSIMSDDELADMIKRGFRRKYLVGPTNTNNGLMFATDPITQGMIPRKRAIILNKQPYNAKSMQSWMGTSATVPHTRRALTQSEIAIINQRAPL